MVFIRLDTTVTIPILPNSTTYTLKVFEYNGVGSSTKYIISDTIGNPLTFKACPGFSYPEYLGITKYLDDPDFDIGISVSDNSNVIYSISDTSVVERINGLFRIKNTGETKILATINSCHYFKRLYN